MDDGEDISIEEKRFDMRRILVIIVYVNIESEIISIRYIQI